MRVIEQEFVVSYRYGVYFTEDLFALDNDTLEHVVTDGLEKSRSKMLFVVDEGITRLNPGIMQEIKAYCASRPSSIMLVGDPISLPGGEHAKNDHDHVTFVQDELQKAGLCRHSYVVAIGGGALLDLVGYAAATAHRGIRLIRVPTTVLGQNDSGVGVKNGVNAFGKKNFLARFAPPYAVLNDYKYLTTLSDRDWRCGIVEAVKVALIKDGTFFRLIEQLAPDLVRRDQEAMEYLIYRCAELHLNHIATAGDPFEVGSSRPLDFGHWAAHKLEQLTNYELRHGEAVAIGIALDSTYSYLGGLLRADAWLRILHVLTSLGFDIYTPVLGEHLDNPSHPRSILHGLEEFREHLGGVLTIMLLSDLGTGVETNEMSHELLIESIHLLAQYQQDASKATSLAWNIAA